MNKNIVPRVFKHNKFGTLIVIGNRHNPLYCFFDICKAIECKCHGVIKIRLEEDGGEVMQIPINMDGRRVLNFVSEVGMFTILCSCTKKVATEYRKYICNDVLPVVHSKRLCSDSICEGATVELPVGCTEECTSCETPCVMRPKRDYVTEIATKVATILKDALERKDEELRRKDEQIKELESRISNISYAYTQSNWSFNDSLDKQQ